MPTTYMVIPLTSEVLRLFRGCQAEIKSWRPAHRFVGEVEECGLRGDLLILKFAWLLRDKRFPARVPEWEVCHERGYVAHASLTTVTALGVEQLRVGSHVQPLRERDIEIITFLPPGQRLIENIDDVASATR